MRPKIIQLYIARSLLPLFFFGMGSFVFLLVMSQVLRINELLVVHGVPLRDVSALFIYLLCMFLSMSVPMALFFAVVGTFGRLSADNEITACRAAGISLHHLLMPVVIFALLLTGLTYFLTSYIEPLGHRSFRYLLKKVATVAVTAEMKTGLFQREFYGFTFYAENIDFKTKVMQHVVVHDTRDQKHPLALFARQGMVIKNDAPQANEFDIVFRLFDGRIINDGAQVTRHQSLTFSQCDINLNVNEFFSIPRTIPEILTTPELKACQQDPDEKMRIACSSEFHRRYALAGGCMIFALAGLVLGLSRRKSAKSRSFIYAIAFSVLYWLLILSSSYFSNQKWLSPAVAMWWPNGAVLFLSLWAYRRHLKNF